MRVGWSAAGVWGRYTVVVDTTGLGGDSLIATGAIPSEVTITAQGGAQSIAAIFGFAP